MAIDFSKYQVGGTQQPTTPQGGVSGSGTIDFSRYKVSNYTPTQSQQAVTVYDEPKEKKGLIAKAQDFFQGVGYRQQQGTGIVKKVSDWAVGSDQEVIQKQKEDLLEKVVSKKERGKNIKEEQDQLKMIAKIEDPDVDEATKKQLKQYIRLSRFGQSLLSAGGKFLTGLLGKTQQIEDRIVYREAEKYSRLYEQNKDTPIGDYLEGRKNYYVDIKSGKDKTMSKSLIDKINKWVDDVDVAYPTNAEKLVNAGGSMAFFAVASLATGGSADIPVLMEALGEAGSVYTELRDQGKDIKESGNKSNAVLVGNIIVSGLLNVFDDIGADKTILAIAKGMGTEFSQEGSQQIMSNLATGRPVTEGVLESAIIGGILGGGTVLVFPDIQTNGVPTDPDYFIDELISTDFAKTKEGQKLIKIALEAKEQGKSLLVNMEDGKTSISIGKTQAQPTEVTDVAVDEKATQEEIQDPIFENELDKKDYDTYLKEKLNQAKSTLKEGEVTVIHSGKGNYVDTITEVAVNRGVGEKTKVFNVKEELVKTTKDKARDERGERLVSEKVIESITEIKPETEALEPTLEEKTTEISTDLVESGLPKEFQSKINRNTEKIKQLEEAIKRGDKLPAIPVYKENGKYYTNKDGDNRLIAYQNLGIKNIPVRIEQKTTLTGTQKQKVERAKAKDAKEKEVSKAEKTKKELSEYYKSQDQEAIGQAWYEVMSELDIAEAGQRLFNEDGEFTGAISSTFPDWIPEDLRIKKLFDSVMKGLEDPTNIDFPPNSQPRKQALFEEILSEIDYRAGTDSSGIIERIKNVQKEEIEAKEALDRSTERSKRQEKIEKYLDKRKTVKFREDDYFLREGQPPIGQSFNSELVARERFDIPNLEKLSFGGSDRDVFDLGNGTVLKIAKTARGLAQNMSEGEPYAPVPKSFESGKNYVVVEKVGKPDKTTKQLVKDLNEAKDFNSRTPAIDMINDVSNKYIESGNENLEEIGYLLQDLNNYSVMINDLTSIRNWGTDSDGMPSLLDAGSLNTNVLDEYKGVKNLNDPDFREVYNKSREAKKKFEDVDKYTKYRLKDDLAEAGYKITDKQEQQIIDLNKRIFGDENIKITAQIMANNKALGAYSQKMIEVLGKQAKPKDTFFHEAVHKYIDIFTTREEQISIFEEGMEKYKTDDVAMVEEKIAEDFIKYANDATSIKGAIARFFEKIFARIKAFNKNASKIEKLYEEILSPAKVKKTKAKTVAGEIKASKVAVSIEQKLGEKLDNIAGYKTTTVKYQKKIVSDLIAKDMDKVRDIISGKQPMPDGMDTGIFILGVEQYVEKTGETDLLRSLATSSLASEGSIHGRSLRMLAERDKSSVLAKVQSLADERAKIFEKTHRGTTTEKAIKKEVKKIKESTKKVSKYDWNTFINSIEC